MINILHVDDNPDDLELTRIRIQLASEKLNFEGVESADNALKRLEAGGFDCIISDYQMPGMSGLEFLRRLREEENLVPFIFLTGQGSEELAAEALRAGADDYYPKETGFAHFERLVNSIFRAVEHYRERVERILTFAEMRESEWRYRLLFTTSTDALTLLMPTNGGAELKIIDINPAAEALYSVEKKLVIGTGFDSIPGVRESGLLEAARIVATGSRPETHNNFGCSRKCTTSNLYCLPSGEILITSGDISEQQQTLSALRKSEQRYRSLFESSRDVIFISTVEGQFIDINPRGPEVFGYSRQELLSNNVEMIYAIPKDREKFKEAVAKKGYVENFPNIYRRKDGAIVHGVLSSTVIADSVGKILGYQGIIRDVTEQKEMEEKLRRSESRFRDLTENTSDLVWETDADNRYVYVNPRVKDLLGYERDEVIGKTPLDFSTDAESDLSADSLREMMETHRLIERKDYFCVRKDGSRVVMETSAVPKFSDDGTFKGYRGIDRDITERKILQIRLTQAQKLEAIGQLAAGIAHEINTPTQYVGDNISFLVDAFGDLKTLIDKDLELFRSFKQGIEPDALVEEAEQARKTADLDYLLEELPKALQQSLGGVEQVAKIVRAMKDFSHPGQDEKTATDLNRAIESTITVACNEWKYVAEIDTDFDKNLPLVHCLPNEFNQVILNLITNAAHAIADAVGDGSSGEKGKITISTRREGPWAEIRISDTGTGIPDEIKPRIFDPFFTTKAVGKGTGQGLAISHNIIVDKHGGTITFETETGKGTTLIISIPIGTDGS